MNDHDDAQIDAALEALARPAPPADQVARVLAATGPDVVARAGSPRSGRDGSPSRPSASPFRWALPIAATLLVGATTWMLSRGAPVDVIAPIPAATAWSQPHDVDRPVLPPQAYWAMDAFQEFRTLRPDAGTGTEDIARPGHQAFTNAGRQRGRSTGSPQPPVTAAGLGADDELGWAPETARSESGPYRPMLPSLELVPIEPAPLAVTPLAPLEDIALAEIPLEPIVIAPLSGEENP